MVVGIGASAGGLDACRKLMHAMPAQNGMAFILVQHLDPTHESMMVDLLAGHTSMVVRQASNGMPLKRDHFYIIPPGAYLSVSNGALHLSQPQGRHGAPLPFDFLLHSLAEACAARAACVVLSGTGADGSLGLKMIKEKTGLVIVQDPDEAGYDSMPRSAIMTGAADLVLPVAKIPDALIKFERRRTLARTSNGSRPDAAWHWLPEIVDLLRQKTSHDFAFYKQGTLRRRIERRMAMAGIASRDVDRYLEILRGDIDELGLLGKDLLINVTSFFRDPKVFDLLAGKIVPDLVRSHPPNKPLRIWVAGCSTGEETYSLAMLFREEIAAAKSDIKLQVFASDADPDAVASAREGLYPETIETAVSPERLARFFSKEDRSYRVSPALRAAVVFTVQDVLADPPFSRLDLVSCRNVLIYLRQEAQAKIISAFHFALREGGVLVLGSSETTGDGEGRFEQISKSERLYRRMGRSQPGKFTFSKDISGVGIAPRPGPDPAATPPTALAELCRQLVMETYAPAAVLINRKFECLHHLGPTARYLKVATGRPMHDLLAMAREGIRTKLRSAIRLAHQEKKRIVVAGCQADQGASAIAFSIAVQPVPSEGDALLLVCFIDEPKSKRKRRPFIASADVPRVAELEQELEATRTELQGAIHNLELSSEEQKAINEEALSVSEEFQSTNEELLTSKEKLQSVNEELTALNNRLQEALERQRVTFNDLQNILYSTDVATLLLDTGLNIRFFTPATKALFNIIQSDIGRPIADLSSLAADDALLADAATVLRAHDPIEQEIEARSGAWYIRRILPYRAQDSCVEGIVITFTDITERRHAAVALDAARRQAQIANAAKSRFLAAASHDLRQPLQTLALLQEQLAKTVEGDIAQKLVARLDQTLGAMSGMLNALLDINQIEAGTVRADVVRFQVGDLLKRVGTEFVYQAQAQSLGLRVVPCSLWIRSDPRLLEQMIRNLLSNALKYTKHGKVLLGCRRREGALSIQIWDTGAGIPENELQAIFEEYHQLDNAARERSRGLGLGLSIVQSLGKLLKHEVRVRSVPGKGSVFAIEIDLPPSEAEPQHERGSDGRAIEVVRHTGAILVVEDDPEALELLELLLKEEGHHIAVAPDGVAALELVARGVIRPDLTLADYNLPNGMDGLQIAVQLREKLQRRIPVIILTGDISSDTLREIARCDCVRLSKPVKLNELTRTIQRLLPLSQSAGHSRAPQAALGADSASAPPVVFVVDDDIQVREAIRALLEEEGRCVESFANCEAFLKTYRPGREACLLVDAYLPGMSGLQLLQQLRDEDYRLPAIMITGMSDVPVAVKAMMAGACDFIEKPVRRDELLASIERALEQSRDSAALLFWRRAAASNVASLTPRQRQVMGLVLAGHPSKNIAADLGISQRTVESHRASIMKKTGSKSLPELARRAWAAGLNAVDGPPVQDGHPRAIARQKDAK